MGKIEIESPIRYEKKEIKIKMETNTLIPGTCKVIDVKEGLLKRKKLFVCVGRDLKEIAGIDLSAFVFS